jgi:osmoprotectant transport system permease protein
VIPLAQLIDQFGDAIDFILNRRESVSGGVQIGGLGEVGALTLNHLAVSLAGLAAAIAIALPIGLYLGHRGRGEFLAIATSNVGRAVPSLALLAFFLAYLGTGFLNVALVMFLLAVPPILTNTFVGIRQVDRDAVDSARGMGMTDRQIVGRVELPLALPTIFAGIRLGAVFVLATATIAPYANVRTLGEPIINDQIYGGSGQLGAAILVALITLVADAGIGALQRVVTPKGIKIADRQRRPRRRRVSVTMPTRREKTT